MEITSFMGARTQRPPLRSGEHGGLLMADTPKDMDEKVKIDLDPVAALRALLAVDPDDEPTTDEPRVFRRVEPRS